MLSLAKESIKLGTARLIRLAVFQLSSIMHQTPSTHLSICVIYDFLHVFIRD